MPPPLMKRLILILALLSPVRALPPSEMELPTRADLMRAHISLLDAHIAVVQLGWVDQETGMAEYRRLSRQLIQTFTESPLLSPERDIYRSQIRDLEAELTQYRNVNARLEAELKRLRQYEPPQPK